MSSLRGGRLFAVVFLSYAVGSQLAFSWFGADGSNASFFPAAGVTFAALALVPRRQWVLVLAAAGLAELVVDLAHDIAVPATLGYVVANLVQPLVGATALRATGPDVDVSRTRDLVRFLVCGPLAAPVVGAVLGATNYVVVDGGTGWLQFALEWWAGDGLGILVVGGAVVAWHASTWPVAASRLEGMLLVTSTIASTAAVFRFDRFGLASVPFAGLMATAARLRTRGVAIAGAGAGFSAAVLTAGGHTFWSDSDLAPASGLVYLQLALAVAIATALALAAEVNAREAAAQAVARAEAARDEQRTVATDETLLATIGDALDGVTTVHERCEQLAQVLRAERAIHATVHLAGDEAAPEARGGIARRLHARGQLVGTLWLQAEDGSDLPDLRAAFVEALAARVAVALDNAALYERERDASHALQMGLLGGPLPYLRECDLSALYLPATQSLEVGGDWYDSFWLPNGRLALVVGDVVGHGLDAAITMGQLRGAVRSLAVFSSAAEVLGHLDDFVATVPGAVCATVAYVEYDPASGQMTYACAGHPPPLLVPSAGRGRYLWGGRSGPLGFRNGAARPQASAVVPRDGLLLLYTDGLIERRSTNLDEGFARLLAEVEACWDEPLHELTGRVHGAMLDSSTHDDDVCILVARARPRQAVLHHVLRAVPGELGSSRAALRSWLQAHRASADQELDVVLAVGEATTNAIEHAFLDGQPGTIEILGSVTADGELLVVVRDDGRWIDRPPTPGRGRGLQIMAATMDRVEHHPAEPGTEVRLAVRLHPAGHASGAELAGAPS